MCTQAVLGVRHEEWLLVQICRASRISMASYYVDQVSFRLLTKFATEIGLVEQVALLHDRLVCSGEEFEAGSLVLADRLQL